MTVPDVLLLSVYRGVVFSFACLLGGLVIMAFVNESTACDLPLAYEDTDITDIQEKVGSYGLI